MSATPKKLTLKNWCWVGDSSEAYERSKHKTALWRNFHKPDYVKFLSK